MKTKCNWTAISNLLSWVMDLSVQISPDYKEISNRSTLIVISQGMTKFSPGQPHRNILSSGEF